MTVNPLKARLSRKNIAATLKLRTALALVAAAGLLSGASQAWAQTPSIDILYTNPNMTDSGAQLTNVNGTLWGEDKNTGIIYSYNTTNNVANIYSGSSGDTMAFTYYNGYLYNAPNNIIQKVNPSSGAVVSTYSESSYSPMFGTMLQYNNMLYGTSYYGSIVAFNPNTGSISSLGVNSKASIDSGFVNVNGMFYGTTWSGGTNGYGSIFSFNPVNNSITSLFSFNNTNGSYPEGTNPLAYNNGVLYGVTFEGGAGNNGVLFSYNIASNTYTILQYFNSATGTSPDPNVLYDNGVLYGTTMNSGANNNGTVFSYNLINNSFNVLASFNATDGAPSAGLTVVGNTLYGVTGNDAIYEVAGYQVGSITTPSSGDGTPVPEPSSLLLFAPALLGLGLILKRKQSAFSPG